MIIKKFNRNEMGTNIIYNQQYTYIMVISLLANFGGTQGSKGKSRYIKMEHFSKEQ